MSEGMSEEIRAQIARFMAEENGDPNVRVELPPNAEIHFVGNPILALDPRLNNTSVPARFRNHRLVEDRYFCTLPCDFWDLVYNGVGPECFDPELVELET